MAFKKLPLAHRPIGDSEIVPKLIFIFFAMMWMSFQLLHKI